jgi:hypothetical protein
MQEALGSIPTLGKKKEKISCPCNALCFPEINSADSIVKVLSRGFLKSCSTVSFFFLIFSFLENMYNVMAEMIEHLLRKHEVLSSNLSTAKINNK